MNVQEATDVLLKEGLVKNEEGTRRLIRKGILKAQKIGRGYVISKQALDVYLWLKKTPTESIVDQLLDLNVRPNIKQKSKYRVASFFAGIGGFDLGCERAGMEVVFQCEVNPFCQKVLKKHWPKVPFHPDIRRLHASEIPDANIWCGGFPCQDVSSANQGKRKGLNGERSGLFYTYAELVRSGRPDWLVIENVPGLLNSHGGADFGILLRTLDELGYGVSWRVLDSKYFGTPQRRRRVFIVASYGDMRSARVLFDDGANRVTTKTGRGQRSFFAREPGEGLSRADVYSIQHSSIGRKHTAGPQAKGYRNDGETYTLDSRGSADAICAPNAPYRVRTTPGLPGRVDPNRYRITAVGNAVTVPVVEWIARRIIAADMERKA